MNNQNDNDSEKQQKLSDFLAKNNLSAKDTQNNIEQFALLVKELQIKNKKIFEEKNKSQDEEQLNSTVKSIIKKQIEPQSLKTLLQKENVEPENQTNKDNSIKSLLVDDEAQTSKNSSIAQILKKSTKNKKNQNQNFIKKEYSNNEEQSIDSTPAQSNNTNKNRFDKQEKKKSNLYIKKTDFSEKNFEEINKKLFQKALWLCSKSEQLSTILSQKLFLTLKKWNITNHEHEQLVSGVITKLKSYGYVDDVRFCKLFIKNKSQKKALKKCLYELAAKGASKDTISLAMEEYESESVQISPQQQIYTIWKKKFDEKPLNEKDKQKQMRYFASRGFNLNILFDIWKNPQNFIDFD